MMRHARLVPLCTLLFSSLAFAGANPPGQVKDSTISLPQLHGPARILRDVDGMPHIYAHDEHDAVFLQGWVTAQDRLFQIDVIRRQASGTLAELAGSGALGSDIELRTIGLRRAAEGTDNVVPHLIRCAHAGCTEGEMIGTLRGVFGEYREPAYSF